MTGRRLVAPVITLAVVIVLVLAGAYWYTVDHRPSVRFGAIFSATVGVYPGSDVRMLGVRVGKIDSVTPQGSQVLVKMHLNKGYDAAANTGAVILSPTLVSDRYVQLTGLYTSGAKLAKGTTIPLNRTATPVELDQLYSSVNQLAAALGPDGANSNGALSNLLNTGAANLGGNGKAFQSTLTNLSKASSVFADSKDNLFATIDNLKSFTTLLAQNNSGVAKVNSQLASVSQLLADDRQSFAAALTQLSSALGSVQKFISDNRARIMSNVDKLATTTQVLTKQKAALQQLLQSAPVAIQNLLNAYSPTTNTLNGRANVNEVDNGGGGVPQLLPSANGGS